MWDYILVGIFGELEFFIILKYVLGVYLEIFLLGLFSMIDVVNGKFYWY